MVSIPQNVSTNARKSFLDISSLKAVFASVAIVIAFLLAWEGAKAFAEANNYMLNIAGNPVDLNIFNDVKLPHLADIIASFNEPAQRNGPMLYEILLDAAAFTLWAAIRGFFIGGIIGFVLAIIFAHSNLLQRGLLPYVVASQTVPILAIAPMIVVWMGRMGSVEMSVPVIAAYLTFFPVTIYTLRGLTSVPATALELMQSYAASRWQILIKLRLPNALPQIFTALKISATASVVGSIIGELPSGIQDGMGLAILNFARYYDQAPPRLWASILVAGAIGIFFFVVVAIIERLVVRWKPQTAD